MDKNATLELLRKLAASGDRARVWFRIDGGEPRPLNHDAHPVDPVWAMEGVRAVHGTATDLGRRPTFSVARFEV